MQEILISPDKMGKEEMMKGLICCARAINDIYYGGYETIKAIEDYIQELVQALDDIDTNGNKEVNYE